MITGAVHSAAQYLVTEPMKKRVTAVLFCFMRMRASGLACCTYWQMVAPMLALLSDSDVSMVAITFAPAEEAFGTKTRSRKSLEAASCMQHAAPQHTATCSP